MPASEILISKDQLVYYKKVLFRASLVKRGICYANAICLAGSGFWIFFSHVFHYSWGFFSVILATGCAYAFRLGSRYPGPYISICAVSVYCLYQLIALAGVVLVMLGWRNNYTLNETLFVIDIEHIVYIIESIHKPIDCGFYLLALVLVWYKARYPVIDLLRKKMKADRFK